MDGDRNIHCGLGPASHRDEQSEKDTVSNKVESKAEHLLLSTDFYTWHKHAHIHTFVFEPP